MDIDFPLGHASHLAISTRHEFWASPGTFLDTILPGDSRLTQPPLSGLPATPGCSGSYFAAASYECTVPGRVSSVT